eukprot:TRINITY_DN2928_c1_g1::TRINITY_DN2928_c1_g1_i22::g.4217::m.4217 TRINITY_DN2928_c1_g1::TRINITY_DN2928_c1_g1_i22::g.4217  ORF type:complete len:119 (-),score=4.26,gag-asp_proteas/PF13975.1/0.09,DUF3077/PF11275.3/0.16 TRINITY_DN2928_c1_g1_i22:32-388(-)
MRTRRQFALSTTYVLQEGRESLTSFYELTIKVSFMDREYDIREEDVYPISIETFGHLGKKTTKLFRILAGHASCDSGTPYSVMVRRLYERVSIELQRANASLVRSFYNRSLQRRARLE